MRTIKYIVLHCTAGPQNQSTAVIKAFWKNVKKWKQVGYHYLINANGDIENLLPIEEVSNGVAGFNANSIHICYKGGIGAKKEAVDNRTDAQKESMKNLLTILMHKFPTAKVLGHRDFSPDKNRNGIIEENEWMKTCPSFSVRTWLKEASLVNNPIIPEAKRFIKTRNGGNVNLRERPTTSAPIVHSLEDGTVLMVLSEANGWSHVEINDKIEGFVKSEFIK